MFSVWFSATDTPLDHATTEFVQPTLLPQDGERDEPETACERGVCFV